MTAAPTPGHPLFGPNQPVTNDGGDEARADHANRDPRHDIDEIRRAFAQRGGQYLWPAAEGNEAHGGNRAPQDYVDDKRCAHSLLLSPLVSGGYIRP